MLGYDISSRIARVMSLIPCQIQGFATHSIGPLFGATAAAAALAKLDGQQVRHAFAYKGQQASGFTSWPRDEEHVEKAFVFAGMGARKGVTSVLFVQHGFTGEEDIFSGSNNFLDMFCPAKDQLPKWLDNLGSHFEIMVANIKKFPVGSPIQAAAEAMTLLVGKHGLPHMATVLGFVLGSIMETNLRRGILINHGSYFTALFKSPLSSIILAIAIVSVVLTLYQNIKKPVDVD